MKYQMNKCLFIAIASLFVGCLGPVDEQPDFPEADETTSMMEGDQAEGTDSSATASGSAHCGNGIVEPGEVCDFAADWGDCPEGFGLCYTCAQDCQSKILSANDYEQVYCSVTTSGTDDGDGKLSRTYNETGQVVRFLSRDAAGKKKFSIDYEYDKWGNLSLSTKKDSHGQVSQTIETISSAANTPVESTTTIFVGPKTAAVTRTVYEYDASGRTFRTTTYNGNGDKISTIGEVYDKDGHNTRTWKQVFRGNSDEVTTTREFDAEGRVVEKVVTNNTEGTAKSYRFEYGEHGMVTRSVDNQNDGKVDLTTTYEHDAKANVVNELTETGGLQFETERSYDEMGLILSEDANKQSKLFSYDSQMRITHIETDTNGDATPDRSRTFSQTCLDELDMSSIPWRQFSNR